MSDFPPSTTGQWSIYSMQKTLPVLGQVGGVAGAHNYLVLVDPSGTIISEMQGTFSDHFTMGGPDAGNYLQVKMYDRNTYMADQTVMSSKAVFSGTQDDMQTLFQTGFNAVAGALDSTHMLYDGAEFLFGHAVNSNSVWNTALSAMGVKDTSQYDGPLSTPGNDVDLRTEPTNNTWFGTSKDPWSANPSFSTKFGTTTGSADDPANGFDIQVGDSGIFVDVGKGGSDVTVVDQGNNDSTLLTLQGNTTDSATVEGDVRAIVAGMNSASATPGSQVASNGPIWIVPGVLAIGPNGQLIAADAMPGTASGSSSFSIVAEGASGQAAVTKDTTISATIGQNQITIVNPSTGNPFAVTQSTDATASSSNMVSRFGAETMNEYRRLQT